MRFAARVDKNQGAIVDALRAAGALVCSLAAVGKGVPDLLVAKGKRVLILEVKNGAKSPSRRTLTQTQKDWQALGWPVTVVNSVDDALAALNQGTT